MDSMRNRVLVASAIFGMWVAFEVTTGLAGADGTALREGIGGP